jgi:large subunit ribosomal protein L10
VSIDRESICDGSVRSLDTRGPGSETGLDRTQKQQLVEALQQDLADIVCMVVTHQSGLNVAEVTQLRRQVRGAGASFRVTKNRLARRALAGTAFEPLAPLFTGPTAIAFSRDPVAAAKVVVEFANRNHRLTIIGGGFAGRKLDAAGVKELASLPSLDGLRGKLVGLLQAPAARLAAVLQAAPAQLVRVLAAYAKQTSEAVDPTR